MAALFSSPRNAALLYQALEPGEDISPVRKKQQKGLTAEEIAEILENNVESINSICKAMEDSSAVSDGMVLQILEEHTSADSFSFWVDERQKA